MQERAKFNELNHNKNMKNIFCRGFLSLAFTLVAATTSFAQTKPLKIGEPLPEKIWSTPLQLVNHPEKIITLNQDKDKLILLDFWATWCSSCLVNFSKMEELQKQFGDKIKILAVTDQSRVVLEKFFASTNGKRYDKTISVADDKMFHQLFPHKGVPYIVWIKNGKLLNTTDADQITATVISEIIENKQSSLQTVIQIDKTRPLLLSENYDTEKNTELQSYAFFSKGRIRALDYGTWFHRDKGKTYGRQFTNKSLMEIYSSIGYELFEQKGDVLSVKRMLNAIQQPENIDFNTNITNKETDAKLYSIDFIVPKAQSDSLYSKMLRFINENTPYKVSLEKRVTHCLVLKRTSGKDKLATKGGILIDGFLKTPSVLQNTTLAYMISALNANNNTTSLPIIDETGYKGKVDLRFSNVKDLKTLQKELAQYDLALEQIERPLLMLVIKDK